MKALIICVLSCVVSFFSFGQKKDTTVTIQGKIVNSLTKELVPAFISYQSLPYASKVGALQGSNYSFTVFGKESYSITVAAEGFQKYNTVVDPANANAERVIVKDIELIAEAAKPTESTHTVGKVIPLNNLIFAVSSSKIAASSHPQLNDVAKMLHDNPNMVIQIEGHTDFQGKPKDNMRLSEDRVIAVRDYLISKGVPRGRVKTKAFGGTKPISRENNEKSHALNRRVEARILEN